MRTFFSQYGKVVDCTVMVDRETGRSKGFGFVTFEDASNTEQLVGQPNLFLDEKQVRTAPEIPCSSHSRLPRSKSKSPSLAASETPHAAARVAVAARATIPAATSL